MVVRIITLVLNLSRHFLLSCPNSLNAKPCSSNLLLLVVCFIRLLQRCCNCFPFLHLNLSLLLSLFLKIYCLTQVHTYISKRVNSHSFFKIAMKFISCFFYYCRWPSYNEGSSLLSCKFPFNRLFYHNHCYCYLYSLLVLLLLPSCFSN